MSYTVGTYFQQNSCSVTYGQRTVLREWIGIIFSREVFSTPRGRGVHQHSKNARQNRKIHASSSNRIWKLLVTLGCGFALHED